MCRHLAYLGPPRPLHSLLYEGSTSLEEQTRRPRHQREGATNLDGWGVGWWDPATGGKPERYRTATPMDEDTAFRTAAETVCSGAVLAAVRNATPGFPIEESGNAPFASGPWLFSLNGFVAGYAGPLGAELRRAVSPQRAAAIEGAADTEVLFALVLDLLDAGSAPRHALAQVVGRAAADGESRLNLLLGDGHTIWATTYGNSLFALHGEGMAGEGIVVASEPVDDDPGWFAAPESAVVEADPYSFSTGWLADLGGPPA
jgi:glutamine amidotransferase